MPYKEWVKWRTGSGETYWAYGWFYIDKDDSPAGPYKSRESMQTARGY